MPAKNKDGLEAKLRRITELVAPRDRETYGALHKRLAEARELFHDLLAERLTEGFNAHLASLPSQTMEQKQQLTRDANADLRALGLAVKCPKTGQPAVLHADRGNHPAEGRFQVALISAESNRKRTLSSPQLFSVELMGHPTRREPLAEHWAERLAAQRGGGTPKTRPGR